MDADIKQALLDRFSAWLDAAPNEPDASEDPAPATDLYSLLVEMAGLRTEVRTESRLVKEALDQFRGVFETLQTSHATLRQELERARAETGDHTKAAVRPLLLDLVDLRDRLLAALSFAATAPPPPPAGWFDRLLGRAPNGAATGAATGAGGAETWQEGLRLTLRRLDQMLLDRRVVPLRLEGHPFDPLRARVVAVADSDAPDGIVVEEVRAGFLWDDQVLRTAEVIVSKSGAQTGDTP